MSKDRWIKLFRDNGFNCFPIPQYAEDYLGTHKAADRRYDGENTELDQNISDTENYGVLPIKDSGSCIIDFDDKERYRQFAEENIQNGWMVIETPHGWHLPIKNLTGFVQKLELYNFKVQQTKIMEIQGSKHYVIGCGCTLIDEDTRKPVSYVNVGSDKIWDGKGKDFDELVSWLCKTLDVTGKKSSSSRMAQKRLRDNFKEGIPPKPKTSNDYFFQAALVCNTVGLTRVEAFEKVSKIYEKWDKPTRSLKNIEQKIDDVYDNDLKVTEGRPKKEDDPNQLDTVKIARDIIGDRKIYKDYSDKSLWENKNGFLEEVTREIQTPLHRQYPIMKESEFNDICFKLRGYADEMPETNGDLIAFKNGVWDRTKRDFIETEEIADMGFKEYDYLESNDENKPEKFISLMFDNIPTHEHPRVKAALKSAINPKLERRISVTQGETGVGKSAGLTILVLILKDYALSVELDQLLNDPFIKAKIKSKTLLVLTDMPRTYKNFTVLKTLSGEIQKSERAFFSDHTQFTNKLKIWGSANYLAKIPEAEAGPMFGSRLSLIHNTRELPYPITPNFEEDIVKDEGEKIISWILNIPDSECEYELGSTVRKEWTMLSNPEIEYLEKFWEISEGDTNVQLIHVKRDYENKYQNVIPMKTFTSVLEEQGYVIKFNVIKNIKPIPQKVIPAAQNTFARRETSDD
jgi:hypothetical protein